MSEQEKYSDEFLRELLAQEDELQFDSFSLTDAWTLGVRLRDAAVAESLPVALGITLGQQRVFHTALDGANQDNDDWLARKTRVVLRYGHSSLAVGESFRVAGGTFETKSRLDPGEFAGHGGVFPIRVRASSVVIGAVGVSGLPQLEDHALVVAVIRSFLAEKSGPTPAS